MWLKASLFAAGVILAGWGDHLAQAHNWYPTACCSAQDCEKIPIDGVRQNSDGSYDVDYTSTRGFHVAAHIAAQSKQLKDSQDGSFHGCASPERFICLLVPINA